MKINLYKYSWKFQNIGTKASFLNIGIDNANAKWVNSYFHVRRDEACYAYHGNSGDLFAWNQNSKRVGSFYKIGGILIMKLKFTENNAILSYKANDEKEFIAWNNITTNKELKYRLAVTIRGGNGLRLIEFTEQDL